MTRFHDDYEATDALGLADLVRRKQVSPAELLETRPPPPPTASTSRACAGPGS
jgi:hypothetical protein